MGLRGEDARRRPDGRADFHDERFIYLGDQANMPYGNYAKAGRRDFLRELIFKDAIFLLGNRYREEGVIRHDKPPVKAIVIACNTATAYGLDDLRAAVNRWNLPVLVVGVEEAGARGVLETGHPGAIGVLATVGTCDSGVYPRTIQGTLGLAGRRVATITQQGSADLAAVIEGDPSRPATVAEQVAADVRRRVDSHRASQQGAEGNPLTTIVLGCTHFPRGPRSTFPLGRSADQPRREAQRRRQPARRLQIQPAVLSPRLHVCGEKSATAIIVIRASVPAQAAAESGPNWIDTPHRQPSTLSAARQSHWPPRSNRVPSASREKPAAATHNT